MEALRQLFWLLLLGSLWQVPGHQTASVGCIFSYFSMDLTKAVYNFIHEKLDFLTNRIVILPYNFLSGTAVYAITVNIAASLGIISVAILLWRVILSDNITTCSALNKILEDISQPTHLSSESERHQNVKNMDLDNITTGAGLNTILDGISQPSHLSSESEKHQNVRITDLIKMDAGGSAFFPGFPLLHYPVGGPLSPLLRYGPPPPPWWPLGPPPLPPPPATGQSS